MDTGLEECEVAARAHHCSQHNAKEQTLAELVRHSNGLYRKRKQQHGAAFRSTKEVFAALHRSGWSIAMPGSKLGEEKKKVCGNAQVDKLDSADTKIQVCATYLVFSYLLIRCSLMSHLLHNLSLFDATHVA